MPTKKTAGKSEKTTTSAAKKTNTASKPKANSAAKKTPAKSGGQSTAKKKTEQNQKPRVTSAVQKDIRERENRRFWSYIIFAMGILELLLTFVKGDGLWFTLYSFNRGIFGITVFLFAPMLIYVALMIASDLNHNTVLAKFIEGTILMVLLSGIAQIIQIGSVDGSGFVKKVVGLYNDGKQLRGGGVASAVIGWPLLAAFKRVGAAIIIILVAFTFVLLLTNITLPQFLKAMTKPFRKGYQAVNEERYERVAQQPEQKGKIIRSNNRRKPSEPQVDFAKYIPEDAVAAEVYYPIGQDGEPQFDELQDDIMPAHLVSSPMITEDKLQETAKSTDNPELKKIIERAIARDSVPDENEKNEKSDKSENKEQKEEKPLIVNVEKNGQTTFFEKDNQISAYVCPPVDILKYSKNVTSQDMIEQEISEKSEILVETLAQYGVQARVANISRGPTVTRYDLQRAAGVKVNKINNLSEEIKLDMAASSVRIESVPGTHYIGVEVPNTHRDTVSLRELIDSDEFRKTKSKLSFVVGKDIEGRILIGDMAKMPHLLIAGTTGSGKSVFTNSIILSILYNASPDEVKLILIDPKKVEFTIYDKIPHLLIPVVTDPLKAAGALGWALNETIKRYNRLEQNHVKNLAEYNDMVRNERAKPDGERNEDVAKLDILPQILIVIDEFADLMLNAKSEVEDTVSRIAGISRAAGIHMIIATQTPRKDIITGLIKANIPSRVSLKVGGIDDSRVIFDYGGAEKLLGNGDLFYKPVGVNSPIRIQSAYASNSEIKEVVKFLRSEQNSQYSEDVISEVEDNLVKIEQSQESEEKQISFNPDDELIDKAITIIVQSGKASTSFLQRKLSLGFSRASRIMDEIEERGIIGEQEGSKPRDVLITEQQWLEMRARR